jgi:hypothetical protein
MAFAIAKSACDRWYFPTRLQAATPGRFGKTRNRSGPAHAATDLTMVKYAMATYALRPFAPQETTARRGPDDPGPCGVTRKFTKCCLTDAVDATAMPAL